MIKLNLNRCSVCGKFYSALDGEGCGTCPHCIAQKGRALYKWKDGQWVEK